MPKKKVEKQFNSANFSDSADRAEFMRDLFKLFNLTEECKSRKEIDIVQIGHSRIAPFPTSLGQICFNVIVLILYICTNHF